MFIRSLDEKEFENEEYENMGVENIKKIFRQSQIGESMRWNKFKNNYSRDIFNTISNRVFSTTKNMKNGRLSDFNEKGKFIEIDEDIKKDTNSFTIQIYTENFKNNYISVTDIGRCKSYITKNWMKRY